MSSAFEAEAYLLESVRYIRLSLLRGCRMRDLARLARYAWCGHAGLSFAETARQLGVSTSGVAKAVARAETE